jgi:hypothetical protein
VAVETTADLLAQLRDQVGFDLPGGDAARDAALLGWLNSRHRRMVADSRCYRRRTVIPGGTVAGQPDYRIPSDVLEISGVEVNGVIYNRARRREIIEVRGALAVFLSPGGVVAQGAAGAGEEVLTLYPTPDTAGLEVALFGPVRAPELSLEPLVNPVVPAEFFEGLVHGAAVPGLRRTESRHGEADSYEQHYLSEIERLRRQTRRRWSMGPTRIRIAWP